MDIDPNNGNNSNLNSDEITHDINYIPTYDSDNSCDDSNYESDRNYLDGGNSLYLNQFEDKHDLIWVM